MKKTFFDIELCQILLCVEIPQQLMFTESYLFDAAGFTFGNLEKLRNSISYKSELYYGALKYIH